MPFIHVPLDDALKLNDKDLIKSIEVDGKVYETAEAAINTH